MTITFQLPKQTLFSITEKLSTCDYYIKLAKQGQTACLQRHLTLATFLFTLSKTAYMESPIYAWTRCCVEFRKILLHSSKIQEVLKTGIIKVRKENSMVCNGIMFNPATGKEKRVRYLQLVPEYQLEGIVEGLKEEDLISASDYLKPSNISKLYEVFALLTQKREALNNASPSQQIERESLELLLPKIPTVTQFIDNIKTLHTDKEIIGNKCDSILNNYGHLKNNICRKTYTNDRHYTAYNSMPKECRKFIQDFNGIKLTSFDMKQSHPSLQFSLFSGKLNIPFFETAVENTYYGERSPYELKDFVKSNITPELRQEIENILIKLQTHPTISKKQFLTYINSDNKVVNRDITHWLLTQGEAGQAVFDYFFNMKKVWHENISFLSLHLESTIMDYLQIKAQKAGIPSLRVHDQIDVRESDAPKFKLLWEQAMHDFGVMQPCTYTKAPVSSISPVKTLKAIDLWTDSQEFVKTPEAVQMPNVVITKSPSQIKLEQERAEYNKRLRTMFLWKL